MPVFDRIIYTVYLSVKKILFLLLGYIFAISVYANNQNKIDIFVSIPPQKFLVEEIGGDKVNVNVMLKPGTNPETFEPTPRQIAALNDSNIYFQIGVPFEAVWIDRVKQINKQLKIISCCKNLFEQTAPVHDLDAHVWTSPENAKELVTIIKNTLIDHDPANQSTYEEKYSVLINKLDQLDIEIRKQLSGIDNRYLIVSHPSWGHFAKAYKLEQISIEQDGSEIRAKKLSRLVEFAKSENIKTIYIQKQVNNDSAKILAREINARLVELDPLAENYIENLRIVANRIALGAQ